MSNSEQYVFSMPRDHNGIDIAVSATSYTVSTVMHNLMFAMYMLAAGGSMRALCCSTWSDHPEPVQAFPKQSAPDLCICEQPEDGHGSPQAF